MHTHKLITTILAIALIALTGIDAPAQTDKYEFKRTNALGTAWTAPQVPTLPNAVLATDPAGAPLFTPQSNFLTATALNSATSSLMSALSSATTSLLTVINSSSTSLKALIVSSTLPNSATLLKITESAGLPLWSGSTWPGRG